MRPLPCLLLTALAGGCATTPKTALVDGREVPRPTLELAGQPFSVRHQGAHPRPGSPSGGLKDAGGSIRGRVCGMFVDFDVTHKGDHVQLVGSLDNRMPAAIDVSEAGGTRRFTGNLGTLGVDFVLQPEQMQGHVGIRVFALERVRSVDEGANAADNYFGYMRVPGLLGDGRLSVVIEGGAALWAMPAADQAAVLPALFTCGGFQSRMVSNLHVGVGGQATDRPPETSAVYTRR